MLSSLGTAAPNKNIKPRLMSGYFTYFSLSVYKYKKYQKVPEHCLDYFSFLKASK